MKGGIFAAFVTFLAVVLALTWAFQTFFMEDLYKNVRIFETKRCVEALLEGEVAELKKTAYSLSREYNVCISVYKITAGKGQVLSESHVSQGCLIHNVASGEFLNSFYERAKLEGELLEILPSVSIRQGEESDGGESIVFARVIDGVGGAEYMFLLNSEIYPIASTVTAMRIMLVLVSGILVLVAALVSVLLAKKLAGPLKDMSLEAEKLAVGNYDVSFKGGAYLEQSMLAETLNNAALELSQLDRMQKDLIANVSHDLRTPLTLISGYSEVMRDIPGEMNTENIQIIIDETRRLSTLVDDMLDMSSFISGRQKLNLEAFDLTETVFETLERYAKLREREGYTIDFLFDRHVFVTADRTRVLQVLYNLVNNAINYTGEDKKVTVKQTLLTDSCLIEVTDSGCGIPENELHMIWERYYKVNEYHKRAPMGTGLGLSIVKNILVLHGAEFGVRSRLGVGSTFWFKLPMDMA